MIPSPMPGQSTGAVMSECIGTVISETVNRRGVDRIGRDKMTHVTLIGIAAQMSLS